MAEGLVSQIGDFTMVQSSQSPLNGVIFHNVQPVYTADEPVRCVYSITESIEPEAGDVIGLFKVGWLSPSEMFSSVGAKLPVDKEKTFLHTIFEGHQLPNDSADMFQFCYVTKKGVVGASTPFTFETNEIIAVEDPADPGLLVFKSRVSQLKDQLHKLSDEKSYYASKYELLNTNFSKLKIEFDKLEVELNDQKAATKELQEINFILSNQLRDLNDQAKVADSFISVKENRLATKATNLAPEVVNNEFIADAEHANHILNSAVWKSLFEIYEVAAEINHAMNSKTLDEEKLSYKALINYIFEVFSATKNKFLLEASGETDENKYCKCYHQQKSFCCPTLCSEVQFQYMMTQPLYTCFSNFNHYMENDLTICDGSFDVESLSDYIKNVNMPIDATKNTECIENISSPSNNNNDHQLSIINKITEERDKATSELKVAKEKVATLNSRVNVLELELVSQLANQKKVDNLDGNKNNCLTFSDIENILESVYSEYISLKEKYNELSKKVARNHSIESKCALLEEENKKLLAYFSGSLDKNEICVNPDRHLCTEFGNLILEKQKAETKLINLQKESVGKISVNLIRQDYQVTVAPFQLYTNEDEVELCQSKNFRI